MPHCSKLCLARISAALRDAYRAECRSVANTFSSVCGPGQTLIQPCRARQSGPRTVCRFERSRRAASWRLRTSPIHNPLLPVIASRVACRVLTRIDRFLDLRDLRQFAQEGLRIVSRLHVSRLLQFDHLARMERRRVKQAVHILTHPDLIKQPPSFNERIRVCSPNSRRKQLRKLLSDNERLGFGKGGEDLVRF
jgi:hypothetical protein